MKRLTFIFIAIAITTQMLAGQNAQQPLSENLESLLKGAMFTIVEQKKIPDSIADRLRTSVDCIDKDKLDACSDSIKYYYYLLSAISCDLQISERLDLVDKAINMRENIIGINDIEYPFCIFIKEIFLKASQAPADERIKLLENAFVVCSNGAYIYNSVEMFESAQHLNSSFLISLTELYEQQGYYKATLWIYLKYFTSLIMGNEALIDNEEPISILRKSFSLLPNVDDKKVVNQYFDQLMQLLNDFNLTNSKLFNLIYGELVYFNGPSDESIIALGRVRDWLKIHNQYDIDLGDIYSKLYKSYKELGYDNKAEALIPEMRSYFETINKVEIYESIINE